MLMKKCTCTAGQAGSVRVKRATPNQTSAERGRKHTARSAMDMENVNKLRWSRGIPPSVSLAAALASQHVPSLLFPESTWAAPRMAPFARMAIAMAVRRGLARAVIRDWDRTVTHGPLRTRMHAPPAAAAHGHGRRASSTANECLPRSLA